MIIVRNVSWASNHEGSCDTEEWSSDAENTALHRILFFLNELLKNRKQSFWIVVIFLNIINFLYFGSNNCSPKKNDVELEVHYTLEVQILVLNITFFE